MGSGRTDTVGIGRSRRTWTWWNAGLAALCLPVIVDAGAIERAARLWTLAESTQPYFVPAHGVLLYLWAPMVASSACVLFLSPGLIVARARWPTADIFVQVVRALTVSLGVVSLVAALGQAAAGAAFRGALFANTVAAVSAAIAVMVARGARDRDVVTDRTADERWAIASMLVLPTVVAAVLAPKFHWEAFNGDGAHAFESARLLLTQPVPFWPAGAGPVAQFPGVTSMLYAYPTSWFIRLVGPIESAARLPLLLYLPVLASALAAAAGVAARRIGWRELACIWLALSAYLLTMAFSASYNAYSADLALPATQDTLLMIVFLGCVVHFVRGEVAWTAVFAGLTYVSLPSGLILLAFWITAAAISRPPQWRRSAGVVVGTMVVCVVGGALLPSVLAAMSLPVPGLEYGFAGLLRYFAFLQFTDVSRLLYIAVPSGVLPIAALVAVGRHDAVARALTLTAAAYFAFFFVQAHVSLHHFVPAMILPIAVLWRLAPRGETARPWIGSAAAAGLVAVWLAWPAASTVHTFGRRVGEAIDNRVAGYGESPALQLPSSTVLNQLFPVDWDPSVPDQAYGGSPLVWNHYAQRRTAISPPAVYVVAPTAAAAPADARRIGDESGFTVYVRNDRAWREHQGFRAPSAASPWLAVPRSTLFRTVEPDGGPYVVDVVALLESTGLDLEPLLRRLGVRR